MEKLQLTYSLFYEHFYINKQLDHNLMEQTERPHAFLILLAYLGQTWRIVDLSHDSLYYHYVN